MLDIIIYYIIRSYTYMKTDILLDFSNGNFSVRNSAETKVSVSLLKDRWPVQY